MASLPSANSLRILSIDGGGIKGYTALLIMKRIFNAIRVEAKKEGINLANEPRPCDVFDLIVGTSTGGLIAVMLGRLHMTVDECIQQYEVLGSRVFGKRQWGGQIGRLAKGMTNLPFYEIDTLQAAIKSVLALRKIEVQEDFKENAPGCKTMVCVTRKKTSKPDVLRNYESEHSTQANYKCTIWEAASATAAAPMFFEAVKFKVGGETWCDGGLHRNNPINVALAELQLETDWKKRPIGCMLSLGTGAPQIKEVSGNLAKFLKGSVDIMTDSEKIADDFAISKDGRELADSRRYFRFSVLQGMEDLQMDEFKETERMKSLTDYYLGKVGSGNEVERCAKSLLRPDQILQENVEDKPSLLPYHNCIHFIERVTYSAELHRFFDPRIQGQRRFVLRGLGGIGKTQIALQYAQSMQSRLSVFWVRADDLANFLNDFSQIMDQLEPSKPHMSTSQDYPLLARNVTARLEKDPTSWLLVLDNADDYDLFIGTAGGKNAISSYVPKEGRVLITTRDPRFQGTVAPAKDGLHVKPMDTSEARDLFMRSIPEHLASQSSLAIVDELLNLLGNLPLALAQAAANIADQQRPVQEYIAAYRDKRNRASLMERPMLDLETQDSRTSRQSILATYKISFEDLERDHQSSARCLNYFGFFHWQKIPESCIRALPGLRELDDQSFRNTIKHLLHLCLIEPISNHDGSEYSVHPVIHERISDRLSLEEKRSYLSDSVAVMFSKFPNVRIDGEREHFASCRYLQSHALLQIKFATEIDLKNEVLVRLNQHCALFLRRSGMTFDSVQLATQAVAIGEEISSPHSWRTIDACIEKIACLNANTQYREGYHESKSAMKRLDSATSDNEAMDDRLRLVLRADILAQMRNACRGLGEYKEAGEIANEIIVLSTDLPGESENSLSDRHSLVVTLLMQKRFQEAQKMNNELLNSMDELQRTAHREMFLRVYREKAIILSSIRNGLDAGPLIILNDEEERAILRIFQDVFDEYRATLPITHLDLWKGCNNLLEELSEKGKTPEAADILVSMLTEAVESRLRLEGQTSETVSTTVALALSVIESLHGYGDARQNPPGLPIANLFVQVIALTGTESRRLWHGSRALNYFSALFQCRGEFQKSEELLRDALQYNKLEEDRSIEGLIHYNLMLTIALQGRIDDARRYRDTHLALIASEESKYGDLDRNLRKYRKEKELYDKAKGILASRDTKLPESWWDEHRIALNRAQLRYGLLVPANAEEDPSAYEDALDKTERKQKGKSRGLGGLIDKLHKTPHSSPHA